MSEDYISEFMKEFRGEESHYDEKDGLEILLMISEQKGMAGHFKGLKELDAYVISQKKAGVMMIHMPGVTKLYGLVIGEGVEEVYESTSINQFIQEHYTQPIFELSQEEHIGEGRIFNKPVSSEVKELIISYYNTFNNEPTRKDELTEMIELLREVEKMI